jgi:hypothetical protein
MNGKVDEDLSRYGWMIESGVRLLSPVSQLRKFYYLGATSRSHDFFGRVAELPVFGT